MDVAIVTGSSRGLGEAVSRQLVERGWSVVGVSRGGAAFTHERYRHARLDLSDVNATVAWFEGLDAGALGAAADGGRVALVNNAGTLDPIALAIDADPRVAQAALSLGVVVPVWLMGWVLRRAPDRPVRIVNVSSGAAKHAIPGWSTYCAGKAALEMAGRVVGAEVDEAEALAGRDVAITSYAPGVLDTEMQAHIRASEAGAFPQVERFRALPGAGALVDPGRPAAEIVAWLERDGLPRVDDRAFRP